MKQTLPGKTKTKSVGQQKQGQSGKKTQPEKQNKLDRRKADRGFSTRFIVLEDPRTDDSYGLCGFGGSERDSSFYNINELATFRMYANVRNTMKELPFHAVET